MSGMQLLPADAAAVLSGCEYSGDDQKQIPVNILKTCRTQLVLLKQIPGVTFCI